MGCTVAHRSPINYTRIKVFTILWYYRGNLQMPYNDWEQLTRVSEKSLPSPICRLWELNPRSSACKAYRSGNDPHRTHICVSGMVSVHKPWFERIKSTRPSNRVICCFMSALTGQRYSCCSKSTGNCNLELSAGQVENKRRKATLNDNLSIICLEAQTQLCVLNYGYHKPWFGTISELKQKNFHAATGTQTKHNWLLIYCIPGEVGGASG